MMDEQQPTANRLAELPDETREFLSNLSKDDIEALRTGLPIFKRVIGFGQVAKWLAIAALSLLAGIVLLGESIVKILSWFSKGA
jgi:hypothetical protein